MTLLLVAKRGFLSDNGNATMLGCPMSHMDGMRFAVSGERTPIERLRRSLDQHPVRT